MAKLCVAKSKNSRNWHSENPSAVSVDICKNGQRCQAHLVARGVVVSKNVSWQLSQQLASIGFQLASWLTCSQWTPLLALALIFCLVVWMLKGIWNSAGACNNLTTNRQTQTMCSSRKRKVDDGKLPSVSQHSLAPNHKPRTRSCRPQWILALTRLSLQFFTKWVQKMASCAED